MSVMLVNNQLVCLRSVGIFNSVFRKCITSISVINTADDKQRTLLTLSLLQCLSNCLEKGNVGDVNCLGKEEGLFTHAY